MKQVSQNVKNFLIDWYQANFNFAEIPVGIAEQIINTGIQKFYENGQNPETDQELFDLFKQARGVKRDNRRKYGSNRKNYHARELSPWDLIDFKHDALYLDFGANNLRNINIFAQLYPKMKFIGMDIHAYENTLGLDFPDRCEYFQVDKHLHDLPDILVKYPKIDYIIVKLMLHHLASEDVLQRLLQYFTKITDKNTQILVWEETYFDQITAEQINSLTEVNNKNGIFTDENLTRQFYNLSIPERKQALLINDMILNYANPHMQWTVLYKSWEEWERVFNEYGFLMEKTFHLGARVNGKLQQGFHTIGIFTKNTISYIS